MSGTGSGARVGDGVPVFGKTGIHEYLHTWMDGSSTKVATVVWVGNVIGDALLSDYYENGYVLSRIRNSIWPEMQGAANAKYGGDDFPSPDAPHEAPAHRSAVRHRHDDRPGDADARPPASR
jgi:membrane peptidoglycan carboxypeptidase